MKGTPSHSFVRAFSIAALLCAASVDAQDQTASLHGLVHDTKETPLASFEVLVSQPNRISVRQTTDVRGVVVTQRDVAISVPADPALES